MPLVGLGAWSDYVTLLRTVSEPVTTPHNFTIGAVLYQAGVSVGTATVVQWIGVVATLVAVVVAARRLSAGADFGRSILPAPRATQHTPCSAGQRCAGGRTGVFGLSARSFGLSGLKPASSRAAAVPNASPRLQTSASSP